MPVADQLTRDACRGGRVLISLGLLVDVTELHDQVRVLRSLDGLGVDLRAETLLAEQVSHSGDAVLGQVWRVPGQQPIRVLAQKASYVFNRHLAEPALLNLIAVGSRRRRELLDGDDRVGDFPARGAGATVIANLRLQIERRVVVPDESNRAFLSSLSTRYANDLHVAY